MKLFLILLLVSTSAFAQTTATLPSNTTETTFPGLSWERIRAKTRINYFNFATGPSLAKWDDNEVADDGTINREPVAMYHSFNIRYNTIGALDLLVTPRFVTPMGDVNDLRANQDHHGIAMDDWDFGVFYTFINKPTFNYAQQAVIRAPYSVKARNEMIDYNYVWQQQVNWAISQNFRMLHWTQLNWYDFNNQSTIERYRLLFRTLLNHTLNDKWMIQYGYEIDLQHRNPLKTANRQHRDMNYMKRYHSYPTIGIGYTPFPQWTFMPYIRSQDERNIRNETTVLGFMVMGRVL